MKRRVSLILALALLLTMIGGTIPAMAAAKKTKTKTTVTLSHKGTITLNLGDTLTITAATRNPEGAKATWKSSKTKVATVDGGTIKANAEGTATITAKSGKGKATVKVKVVNPKKPTGVSIAQGKSITIKKGESVRLSAVLKPSTAQANLKWSTSKKKVATVSGSGVVTGQKKGKAKITVKAGKKKATITVNVTGETYVAPQPQPDPAPRTESQPGHVHTWANVTKTVHHKEEGHWEIQQVEKLYGTKTKTINHPEEGHWEKVTESRMVHEAWDEDVVVVDKEAWSEVVAHAYCNACGKELTKDEFDYNSGARTHKCDGSIDPYASDFTVHHETVNHPAETHIEVVHHDAEYQDITSDVWRIDKPAWTETVKVPDYITENVDVWIVDTPAWDETVVTGRRCTGCGATQ